MACTLYYCDDCDHVQRERGKCKKCGSERMNRECDEIPEREPQDCSDLEE